MSEHPRRLRFLISYYYYRKIDIGAWLTKLGGTERIALFADSGAYSAKTMGETLSVEDYAKWVKKWRHLFDAYANLDVIGDAKATLRNQQKLERLGLTPIPVFHTREDWHYLEDYVKRYRYIALGGLVGTRNPEAWLVRCFQMAGDDAVFHGFGMTKWSIIRDFRFYSIDSSSWSSGHRFGTLQLFERGKWYRAKVGDRDVYKLARLIRSHGSNPDYFGDRSQYHRSHMARINALAWYRAEDWLRERHGDIFIPERENMVPGPHSYLVAVAGDSTSTMRDYMGPVVDAGPVEYGPKAYLVATAKPAPSQPPAAEMLGAAGQDGSDAARAEPGVHVYAVVSESGTSSPERFMGIDPDAPAPLHLPGEAPPEVEVDGGPHIYLVGDHATSASADTLQALDAAKDRRRHE